MGNLLKNELTSTVLTTTITTVYKLLYPTQLRLLRV